MQGSSACFREAVLFHHLFLELWGGFLALGLAEKLSCWFPLCGAQPSAGSCLVYRPSASSPGHPSAFLIRPSAPLITSPVTGESKRAVERGHAVCWREHWVSSQTAVLVLALPFTGGTKPICLLQVPWRDIGMTVPICREDQEMQVSESALSTVMCSRHS